MLGEDLKQKRKNKAKCFPRPTRLQKRRAIRFHGFASKGVCPPRTAAVHSTSVSPAPCSSVRRHRPRRWR